MRNSERTPRRVFSIVAALTTAAAALAGCGTYGDPCLRTTDCGSGFVCVEGKCQIDVGDIPIDAALGDAPGTSDVPRVNDVVSEGVGRDASEEGNPLADSAGADTTPDSAGDGDGAPTSSLDAPRDAAQADTPSEADARAAADTGSGNGDAAGDDVGGDADSASVKDATVDALDAAG
ncbi:MAG TPA: hypothetical protein VK550_15370 [Polyangiaceae bacterium]|nr:hypothetical protein [Polyangiaceae bacterium]